jgi:Tol biopolymer transport system component
MLYVVVAILMAFAVLAEPARAADPGPTEPGTYLIEVGTGRLLKLGTGALVSWSPDSKLVAVADTRPDRPDTRLRLISVPDGTERVIDLAESGSINLLRWSPDGTRIAFTLTRNGRDPGPSLSVVTATTATVRQLVKGSVGEIAWAPDGMSIAAIMMDDIGGSIVTLNAADGTVTTTVLTGNDASCQRGLAWSPDGTRLAYAGPGLREGCGDAGNWGVWIWDQATGKSRHAFEGAADVPLWLANGDLMVMVREPRSEGVPPQALLRFSPAGGDPKPIVQDIPDMFPQPPRLVQVVGSTVLYPVTTCEDGIAYVWSPDQAAPTRPTPAGTYAYRPALAPDARQLAYVRLGDSSDLVVAPLGAGEPRVLASATGLGLQVGTAGAWDAGGDWSPDGKWIAIEVTSEQFKDCVD